MDKNRVRDEFRFGLNVLSQNANLFVEAAIEGEGAEIHDAKNWGIVFFEIIRHLTKARPRAFVMENVLGLVNRHSQPFNGLLKARDQLLGRH